MSEFIAALPMYDWPEVRTETDARWAALRAAFRQSGVDAPEGIVRINADMPPVAGGIRDAAGAIIAPDPATLPPEDLDYPALWLHPALLFTQTCWGPMSLGLSMHVQVIGQPNYDEYEGGKGALYSSPIVMRRGHPKAHVQAPADGAAAVSLDLIRGKRFAYNSLDSMSGFLGISRDLAAMGESLDIFSERVESGGHRASIVAVAEGRADVAAIDCRSWALAQRFEPKALDVEVVGWTSLSKGLPFITARTTPETTVAAMRAVLAALS